jgi:predicted lipoprotein with Yx(FWY)xxD motif
MNKRVAVLAAILGLIAILLPAAAAMARTAPRDPAPRASAAGGRATVAVHSSRFGRILVDGSGRTLYLFTHDPRGRSACGGACAAAWPPLYTHGGPVAVRGARPGLLGTTIRRGGRQVTYAGHPLYYYVGDRRPGQILCQNVVEFGGTWLVVKPSGAPVR